MKKKKPMKSLGINPLPIILTIIGLVASIVTIITFIKLQYSTYLIVNFLVASLIGVVFYIIFLIFKLNKIKIKYNDLLEQNNHANENRETLVGLIKEKNNELDNYQDEIKILNAVNRMLYTLYSIPVESNSRPNKEDVKKVMQIEMDEVIKDE